MLSCDMTTGWIAVILGLIGAWLNFVPGLGSIIGLLVSTAALFTAVFSVRTGGRAFFGTTLIIVLLSVLVLNDGLGLWSQSQPGMGFKARGVLYGLFFMIVALCLYFAGKNDQEFKKEAQGVAGDPDEQPPA